MVPMRPGLQAASLRRGVSEGKEGWSREPSVNASSRGGGGDRDGCISEVAFEDGQGTLCGLPGGFSSLLFGCTTCGQAEGDGQQRTGFRRIMDAWNVDVEGHEEDVDQGLLEEADLELDKVDVVLKLIDAGPGVQKRDFFRMHGWEMAPLGGDRYHVNGREVRLILLPAGRPLAEYRHLEQRVGWATAKRSARIMVEDGPLKQPLLDYLMETGRNEQYDVRGTENFGAVPHAGKMMSFVVDGQAPTRGSCDDQKIDAMKQATFQADMRKRAQQGLPGAATRMPSGDFRSASPTSFNGARRV